MQQASHLNFRIALFRIKAYHDRWNRDLVAIALFALKPQPVTKLNKPLSGTRAIGPALEVLDHFTKCCCKYKTIGFYSIGCYPSGDTMRNLQGNVTQGCKPITKNTDNLDAATSLVLATLKAESRFFVARATKLQKTPLYYCSGKKFLEST